jgi:hypothetical protein
MAMTKTPLSADPEFVFLTRGLAAMLLEWWNRRTDQAREQRALATPDLVGAGNEPLG